MVGKEKMLERWSKYFSDLLSEENEYMTNKTEKYDIQEKFTEEEVKEGKIKEMKNVREGEPPWLTVGLTPASHRPLSWVPARGVNQRCRRKSVKPSVLCDRDISVAILPVACEAHLCFIHAFFLNCF